MADNQNRGKKTRGRQKIQMRRIQNEDDRLITFSKRRSGIYKKASELVTLCGAEVAFVVFSPGGKPFSYGHPSVDSVINRFMNPNQPHENTHPNLETQRRARIYALNQQYNEAAAQLEVEKKRLKEAEKLLASVEGPPGWWEVPVEELDRPMLQELMVKMEEQKTYLLNKLNERDNAGVSSSVAHGGKMDGTSEAQMVLGDNFGVGFGNELGGGPPGFGPPSFFSGISGNKFPGPSGFGPSGFPHGSLNNFAGSSGFGLLGPSHGYGNDQVGLIRFGLPGPAHGNGNGHPSGFGPLGPSNGCGNDPAGFILPGPSSHGSWNEQTGPSRFGPLDLSHGRGNDPTGLIGFGLQGPSHGSENDQVGSPEFGSLVLSRGSRNDQTGLLGFGLPGPSHYSGSGQTDLLGFSFSGPSHYNGSDQAGPSRFGPPGPSHYSGKKQAGPSGSGYEEAGPSGP